LGQQGFEFIEEGLQGGEFAFFWLDIVIYYAGIGVLVLLLRLQRCVVASG
jgi:hypothetical protein